MDYLFAKPQDYKDKFSQELNPHFFYAFLKEGLISYLILNERPSMTISKWYSKNLLTDQQFIILPEHSKFLERVEKPKDLSKKLLEISQKIPNLSHKLDLSSQFSENIISFSKTDAEAYTDNNPSCPKIK